jgi:hypothetical protein
MLTHQFISRRRLSLIAEPSKPEAAIMPNGPAIWGGCVTRRKHRAGSWYFSQKAVTVQGGYGALFAVMVQILQSAGAIAVQT